MGLMEGSMFVLPLSRVGELRKRFKTDFEMFRFLLKTVPEKAVTPISGFHVG